MPSLRGRASDVRERPGADGADTARDRLKIKGRAGEHGRKGEKQPRSLRVTSPPRPAKMVPSGRPDGTGEALLATGQAGGTRRSLGVFYLSNSNVKIHSSLAGAISASQQGESQRQS